MPPSCTCACYQLGADRAVLEACERTVVREKLTEFRRFITGTVARTPPPTRATSGSSAGRGNLRRPAGSLLLQGRHYIRLSGGFRSLGIQGAKPASTYEA
jgi:hypothetical protein